MIKEPGITMKKEQLRWPLLIIITSVIGILFYIGLNRLKFDTDIAKSLPGNDPVLEDARYVIDNHPVQDRIVIDISHKEADMDLLVEAAQLVEEELQKSKYFSEVGMGKMREIMPELLFHTVKNLPMLLTQKELEEKIAPLLKPEKVREIFAKNLEQLSSLEGIGQAEMITRDPLGIKNVALAKLAHLAPSNNVQIYRDQLLSSDGKHLLVMAEPAGSSTDSVLARNINNTMNTTIEQIDKKYGKGVIKISPVGGYRAALDNEEIAKKDTQKAILFATLGIALMLILAFPRPIIGLLSLVPAIVGAMMALFVYSLFTQKISILAVGFGGAIISITVDHGIAYLLFLDRPYETSGRYAAKEVWSVGLLATLTTVGAFSSLFISGFSILTQIGRFAALGISFSFIFVHTIFPILFPVMPAVKRERKLPLQNFVNKFALSGKKYKAYGALLFAVVMLFFAKPEFQVSLSSMNTVSKETLAAEQLVKEVWGDIFSKIFIATEAKSIQELQDNGDKLVSMLEADIVSGSLESAFVPSMIFPGTERLQSNFQAWKTFWSRERVQNLKNSIRRASQEFGFSVSGFDPFFKNIALKEKNAIPLSETYHQLLGIAKTGDEKAWIQFSTLTPGKTYNKEQFFDKYSASGKATVFDPGLFTERLGSILSDTFVKMVIIIGISVIILLFMFFFDWKITLITLAPISFALVSTLGTLKLIGHPLDIPGLMLSIIIIGMGIDYSLFFVRSYQRYRDENSTAMGLIRMAVFLASISTLIGFGVLLTAEHSLLRSAGITSLLGIGYSLIGAFTILPPVLSRFYSTPELALEPAEPVQAGSRKHQKRVFARYKHMEAYPRLFSYFKIRFDPMFPRLADFLNNPETIIDIGTGYAVPAAWILELYPNARVYGLEPQTERVRIAARIIRNQGQVEQDKTPVIPPAPKAADTALMLDMIHYIPGEELQLTFDKLCSNLAPGGTLVLRATVPSEKRVPWERWIEEIRNKVGKNRTYFRSSEKIETMLAAAKFEITLIEPGPNREETWFIAKKL
ncbi:MAG: MMPL family transporter [bacterium]|nr:MMPL family transporter [bacterium]